MNRRTFLKSATSLAAGVLLGACSKKTGFAAVTGIAPRKLRQNNLKSGVFVAEGKDPKAMIRAALKEIGGLESLIKNGDTVVVKPNIGWDRTPELAANTNPELVKELVTMCYKAGAKTVKVFDRTCNDAKRCYKNSGIAKAAEEAGAKVNYVSESSSFYNVVTAPDAVTLKTWSVYQDVMKASVVINVPILKHHGISGLTVSMKNLMGIIGGDRGEIHQGIDKNLSDLTRIIPVELVIVDAYRILTGHGPQGGNASDVRMGNQIIVSTNPVMADAYATKLFGLDPSKTDFLKVASERGIGEINVSKMKIKKIKV
ncbi:MAG: DUF362 domain-containing protein [Candidatus Eremiobacterota bacterium]